MAKARLGKAHRTGRTHKGMIGSKISRTRGGHVAMRGHSGTGGMGQFSARGGGGGYRGFKSKAQWRYFFANPKLRKYAHKKAHETAGGPKVRYRRLPARKGGPSARTAR